MSTAQKVRLITEVRAERGLAVALSALDLARSTWAYQAKRVSYQERHRDLVPLMHKVARQHPEYGYRRAVDELSERAGRRVNAKVVRRLGQVLGLTQLRKPKAPRKSAVRRTIDQMGERANLVRDLEQIGLYEVLFTDFTELYYARGKAYLMPLLDAHSKDVLGWELGRQRCREVALSAWAKARQRLHSLGFSPRGVIVHHDRDSVYTSDDWVKALILQAGARLSFALHGAKDNPEMESWNGRFKSENESLLLEAETFDELYALVAKRMRYYLYSRKHSTIGNQPPRIYVRKLLSKAE
jgi:transposase InsO family protein